LRTRNGRECSVDFPELAEIGSVLGKHRVTLDGELVCLCSDGRLDFARLRRRLTGSVTRTCPAMLQVFDVYALGRALHQPFAAVCAPPTAAEPRLAWLDRSERRRETGLEVGTGQRKERW
jgi:hypothetical protein